MQLGGARVCRIIRVCLRVCVVVCLLGCLRLNSLASVRLFADSFVLRVCGRLCFDCAFVYACAFVCVCVFSSCLLWLGWPLICSRVCLRMILFTCV